MRLRAVISAALAGMVLLWHAPASADLQRALIEALQQTSDSFDINGYSVPMQPIRSFYEERGYLPAWTSSGVLNENGTGLAEVLKNAAQEGLDPDAYKIATGLNGPSAEITLAATLLRYATDVQTGREKPEKIDPELVVSREIADRIGILRNAAMASDIVEFLETLPPVAPEYRGLRGALARYRVIAANGGWQRVSGTETIKLGFSGPEVRALWERLRSTSDIDPELPVTDSFDSRLEEGVIRFQRRHGLTADGAVGARTRVALNVPVSQRIRQIEINMERWRWMPDDLGETHVIVNMAGFNLRAVRNGDDVLTMPVIVGRPYRRTPVFSDRISYMEVNPNWTVPYKIATQDILPKLRADPAYLAKNGFKVLPAGGGEAVDPVTVDWLHYSRQNFPFQLQQSPGPMNALGQIKFMFPNKFAVYLHDTPARELFLKDVRMFSSGCIRVAEPMELAAFLMEGDPAWTRDKLHREVETGKTKVIRLRKSVPVHLSYLTAWVATGDIVNFRDDIYERDTRLFAVMYPGRAK